MIFFMVMSAMIGPAYGKLGSCPLMIRPAPDMRVFPR